jgi:predicted P-loop ATPase
VWKGDKLLDTWAIDYLGAEDTPFVRAVSRRWMISAVARVMEPGCKADAMLVLEGAQGIGKSSVLAALGGEWFSDQLGGEIGSRDAKAGLVGKWIIEHSELAHLNRSAVERMKAFFTEQVDQYRPAYGRNEVEVPRQCVFAGTTNTSDYLRDETGNRRFWPVACKGPCLPDKVKEVRDQLWAEAVQAYRNGEVWWLQGDEIISKAKEEQAARVQDDAWDEAIINWADTARDPFTVQEIITDALKKAVGDITRADEMRVSSILRRYGYDKKRVRQNGNNLNRWSKVGTV